MSRRQSSRKSNRPKYYSPEAKKDAKAKAKATKQKQSKAKDDVRSLILDQASCSSSSEDEFDEDSSSSSEDRIMMGISWYLLLRRRVERGTTDQE